MAQVIGIFVTGASSTGKTTLCRALETRLTAAGITVCHVSEVARTVMKEQGFNRELVGTLAMQRAILQAQIVAETNALSKISNAVSLYDTGITRTTATAVLLCDRCAVDPVVYATMKIDAEAALGLTDDRSFQDAIVRYGGSLPHQPAASSMTLRPIVVLAGGVKEWQAYDDGVRSLYDPFEVTTYFRQTLAQLNIQYSEIGEDVKDIDRRVDWVLDLSGLGVLKGQRH